MKKGNIIFKQVSFIILFLVSLTGISQQYTQRKEINRSFPLTPSMTIEIQNKYGKIQVITWNKDSLNLSAEVIAESTKKEKLKGILDEIDLDFTVTKYFITVQTEFEKRYDSFFNDLLNLAESISSNGNQVEINYTLKIPEYVNLQIDNKFGDVYLDNLVGEVILKLSNGDMKANKLSGNAELHITMGDANISQLSNAKLFLNYAEVHIDEAGTINIDSKVSDIHIDKAGAIKTLSKKDKFYIENIKQLLGESYFSDMNIHRLSNRLNLQMKYGNINLDTLKRDFSFIDLMSEYSDINVHFEKGSSFYLDVTYEDSNLKYPDEFGDLNKKTLDEYDEEYVVYGDVGQKASTSKIKINAKKGNINMYFR